MTDRYPEEDLTAEGEYGYAEDNGTMPDNVDALRQAVIGHRIVKAERRDEPRTNQSYRWGSTNGLVITLDNGKEVVMRDTNDCCAFTELQAFLLHPERVDHMILGVGTTGGFTRWHIYADLGDILELTVGWSCGNPFYYGYGFDIDVLDIEEEPS